MTTDGNKNEKQQGLELFPRWRQVIDEIANDVNITYGSLLTHEWLDRKLELVPPIDGTIDDYRRYELARMTALVQLREGLLKEHCYYLDSVAGKGYRIVLPREQTKVVTHRLKTKLTQSFDKAQNGYTYCAMEKLTETEKDENVREVCRLGMIRSSVKNIFALAYPRRKFLTEKTIEPETQMDQLKREVAELREQLGKSQKEKD